MVNHNRHAIIVEGPPYAGKGSLAEFLNRRFGYFHVDSGEILRNLIKKEPSLKTALREGKLLGDEIVNHAVFDFIPDILPDNLCFTGFPRTPTQLEQFEKFCQTNEFRVGVILLSIREYVAKQRMYQRISEYKKKGEEPRSDDNPETAIKRFKEYRQYGPIIRSLLCGSIHWKNSGGIDASLTKKEVQKEAERFVLKELMDMNLTRRPVAFGDEPEELVLV